MSVHGDETCFKKSEYLVYQPYPGLHLAYHAKRFYFSAQSRFQKVEIIENDAYGRMLLLDGNIQHTAYDACIFNEALCGPVKKSRLAHLVVLGGGSGQSVLSLLESTCVREITVVEIDEMVVEACKKHISGVREAFDDPRVKLVISDAIRFIHDTREHFDAAVIDFTESPIGLRGVPALRQLYHDISSKCNGRCSQYIGSSVALAYDPRVRSAMYGISKRFFRSVKYQEVFIPSFGAPHIFMHAGFSHHQAGAT